MALDTRDRRASAVYVGQPWRGFLPLPDAPAEDQGDRQQVAGYYRGVLASLLGVNDMPFVLVTAISAAYAQAMDVGMTHPTVTALTLAYPQTTAIVLARVGVGAITVVHAQGADIAFQEY